MTAPNASELPLQKLLDGSSSSIRGRRLHRRIRAREDQAFVPVVEAHEIRRAAVAAADLQDLTDPVDVADGPAMDMETVTDLGLHRSHLRSFRELHKACRVGAGRESPDVTAGRYRWRIERPTVRADADASASVPTLRIIVAANRSPI